MIKMMVFFIALLLLSGCATTQPNVQNQKQEFLPYDVLIKMDKFQPEIKTLEGSAIELTSFFSFKDFVAGDVVSIVPKYIFGKEVSTYNIQLIRLGRNWMFINEMIFLINDKPISVKALPQPYREVLSGNDVMEQPIFIITDELFDLITKQNKIHVRFVGDKYYSEYEIDSTTINHLLLFYKTSKLYEQCRVDSTNCKNKDKLGIHFGN